MRGRELIKIVKNKNINHSIFHWIPSFITIKYPKGKALIFTWGYHILILKDKAYEKRIA